MKKEIKSVVECPEVDDVLKEVDYFVKNLPNGEQLVSMHVDLSFRRDGSSLFVVTFTTFVGELVPFAVES